MSLNNVWGAFNQRQPIQRQQPPVQQPMPQQPIFQNLLGDYDPRIDLEEITPDDPRFDRNSPFNRMEEVGGEQQVMRYYAPRQDSMTQRLNNMGALTLAGTGNTRRSGSEGGMDIDWDRMPRTVFGTSGRNVIGVATDSEGKPMGDWHNTRAIVRDPYYGLISPSTNAKGNPWLAMLPALAAGGLGLLAGPGSLLGLMNTGIRTAGNLMSGRGLSPTAGLSMLTRLWGGGG